MTVCLMAERSFFNHVSVMRDCFLIYNRKPKVIIQLYNSLNMD